MMFCLKDYVKFNGRMEGHLKSLSQKPSFLKAF
jgi:hypothetical protein